MAASMCVNPVMLPPGRGRPATNPEPTGSVTIANTIGMVLVAWCNAAVTAVLEQKITSGCDPISSVAKALARLVSPLVHRCSNRTLRPSVQPNRASSSTNAAKYSPVSLSDDPISTPMRRTFSACAEVKRSSNADAPPTVPASAAINSRRCNGLLITGQNPASSGPAAMTLMAAVKERPGRRPRRHRSNSH